MGLRTLPRIKSLGEEGYDWAGFLTLTGQNEGGDDAGFALISEKVILVDSRGDTFRDSFCRMSRRGKRQIREHGVKKVDERRPGQQKMLAEKVAPLRGDRGEVSINSEMKEGVWAGVVRGQLREGN